jgi:hypothetical protein
MSRKKRKQSKTLEKAQTLSQSLNWLKTVYHFHVFHYRMPQTAAIAAITSFVPSPLTLKFAMVASLLQSGKHNEAELLTRFLPRIEILIAPPQAAFSFKAFLRYRSVPAVESAGGLDESGSFYPSRPYTREYSLFQRDLVIFVGMPEEIKLVASDALKNIRYLGCKDSLVWCKEITDVEQQTINSQVIVQPLKEKLQPGAVVLLADIRKNIDITLNQIIPGLRLEEHYIRESFVLPGNIVVSGRTKLFKRFNAPNW